MNLKNFIENQMPYHVTLKEEIREKCARIPVLWQAKSKEDLPLKPEEYIFPQLMKEEVEYYSANIALRTSCIRVQSGSIHISRTEVEIEWSPERIIAIKKYLLKK